jgi:hypothetical protein
MLLRLLDLDRDALGKYFKNPFFFSRQKPYFIEIPKLNISYSKPFN